MPRQEPGPRGAITENRLHVIHAPRERGAPRAIGPLHFSYNASNKRLYLNDPVPNTGVTPARLRKELEDMAALLKRTEPM